MIDKIEAISLFSSAGIGELLLDRERIHINTAVELLKKRSDCYKFFYPETNVITGDISDTELKKQIIKIARDTKSKLLLATPPCQGLSTLGKNKHQDQFEKDSRNYLIFDIIDIIENCDFDYILIENVPRFLDMWFPIEAQYLQLKNLLELKLSNKYKIDIRILNAKDYGVAQSRPRAIVKIYKKELLWSWPTPEKEITLWEAIGDLPSLESGETSTIPWHNAKKHPARLVEAMKHTEPGRSALTNKIYFPKKEDGSRIKGFHNTFKRMVWDQPCPARTTYSGSISSHNNVHPGHQLEDGTYSDSRVLTLLEIFRVSSIPDSIEFPQGSSDCFIRTLIGEAIPPRLLKRVMDNIGGNDYANNGRKREVDSL